MQSEALALADRIVVMREGRVEQVGTPEEIYSRPATGFVADFVGFDPILPEPGGGALALRPGAVRLGEGPHKGRIRGASFAGERREYVIDSEFDAIKADAPVSAPVRVPGEEVEIGLPRDAAVRLEGMD